MRTSKALRIFLSFSILLIAVFFLRRYLIFPFYEPLQRRAIATDFLDALKNKELTPDNALSMHEKYKILSALAKDDISFPITLVDYEFLSEEIIPRGLVIISLENFKEWNPNDPDKAIEYFNRYKKGLKSSNKKELKVDEENQVVSYYDDEPGSYKLNYLLTITNALGMSLKKNGYVMIEKDIPHGYEIVAFKYQESLPSPLTSEPVSPTDSSVSNVDQKASVANRIEQNQRKGLVSKIIADQTISLTGQVANISPIEGSGEYWFFDLKRQSDTETYKFMCSGYDELYFRIGAHDVGFDTGLEAMKAHPNNITLYFPTKQWDFVKRNPRGFRSDGACPLAIVIGE